MDKKIISLKQQCFLSKLYEFIGKNFNSNGNKGKVKVQECQPFILGAFGAALLLKKVLDY
jgi:hypothetical protein